MALVVVGGHARSVGKTSVVAGLIAALPEMRWTAVKITQYGHGICSADGAACDCATGDHAWAITEEHDRSGESDSSRFLVAGAARSWWVRTRQGMLAEAMPALRERLSGNVIVESNAVMKFLRPDVYLTVLNFGNADFKRSALEFLDRASAVLLHESAVPAGLAPVQHQTPGTNVPGYELPEWNGVSLKLMEGKPVFRIQPPEYVTPEVVEFVRNIVARAKERV
jgi:hypothetical protein